jgi:RHS repeat-associated protein
MIELSSIGDPHDTFVYDGTGGLRLPVSAAVYGYDAMPEPVRNVSGQRAGETGLDYFGARYFSGAQGRWTSPDRMNVTDDRLMSPSSTLNKYVYAANDPLRFIDPDGRDVVALLEPPHGIRPGHFMLFANNPANGQSAMMSFGPTDSSAGGQALTVIGAPMSSTDSFNLPKTVDELRNTFAALSIQTTPEQAQDVINFINQFSPTENFYRLYNTNCTTVCRDALKAVGLLPRNYGSITPFALWGDLFKRYANPSWTTFRTTTHGGREFLTLPSSSAPGFDYGNPRFGMNTFDFMMLWLKTPDVHSTFKPCSQDDKGCGGN